MSKKMVAKVFYADLWGLREQKYKYLFENDIRTTKWQELEPISPYYFFVAKDLALQSEYEKFWKVTDIFKEGAFQDEIVNVVFSRIISCDLVYPWRLHRSIFWKPHFITNSKRLR
jgi:hypothetical protein